MIAIWPVFACLESGFAKKNIDGAWVWAPQMANVGGVAGSCSLRVLEIEIACEHQGVADAGGRPGWRNETGSVTVTVRL